MLLGALLGRLFGALLDTLQLQVRLSDCLARICSGGGEKEGVLLNAFKSGQASKIHQTMPIKWIKKKGSDVLKVPKSCLIRTYSNTPSTRAPCARAVRRFDRVRGGAGLGTSGGLRTHRQRCHAGRLHSDVRRPVAGHLVATR